jgi:membrane protein required for colicin V production|tara:strand:- start:1583 stop:2185 length:603 start_codon:yes stop_codon:yes gene_type:complete
MIGFDVSLVDIKNMSQIDIILIIPLLWGAVMGFKKGLILELASLVGLILGIYGAIKFSDYTAEKLVQYAEITQEWLGLISFLVTFIAIVFGVFLLAKILNKALKLVALGTVNRILGLLFGTLKFALIVSIGLYFFENMNRKFEVVEKDFAKESMLYEPIKLATAPFKELMEDFEISKVKEKANDFKNSVEKKVEDLGIGG